MKWTENRDVVVEVWDETKKLVFVEKKTGPRNANFERDNEWSLSFRVSNGEIVPVTLFDRRSPIGGLLPRKGGRGFRGHFPNSFMEVAREIAVEMGLL